MNGSSFLVGLLVAAFSGFMVGCFVTALISKFFL
jgi:hypothetical protein